MGGALRFSVREIKDQEGMTFSGPVRVEELDADGLFGEARLAAPCQVTLEFSVGGSRILLEGRVEAQWELSCSRCLEEHVAALGGELEETYPADADTIEVAEEVRQALVLSLPGRHLCRQDCKGLCAKCGANLNQGPCRCETP